MPLTVSITAMFAQLIAPAESDVIGMTGNKKHNGPQLSAPPESFLAFVSDEISLTKLQQFAKSKGWPEACIIRGNISDAAQHLKSHRTPHHLLVDIVEHSTVTDDLNKLAEVCEPHVKVLVTGTINEYSFFCRLKEMGIEDYLLKPITTESLNQALAPKPATPEGTEAPSPHISENKIIVMAGSRGGIGTTTLAANLGWILAHEHQLQTAILDPDPHFGEQSLVFDLEPSRGLRDALEKPDRIDSLFLERVMVRESDTLHILSAEESYENSVSFHPQAASALLAELGQKKSVILVDLPRVITPFTLGLLEQASNIFVVTEMNVPGLRDTMRWNDLIREKLHKPELEIIVNREGLSKKNAMPRRDFEKSLGAEIDWEIPFEPDLFAYENSGEVLASKHHQSKLVKSLQDIASNITGGEAKAAKKGSLLGRLLSS